jgi:hypothetical protein
MFPAFRGRQSKGPGKRIPMPGLVFKIIGGVLMALGVLSLYAWLNGKSRWFDQGNFDRQNLPRMDAMFYCLYFLYFLVMVILPLLGGALLIGYGLARQ